MPFHFSRTILRKVEIHISKRFELCNIILRLHIIHVIFLRTIYDTTLTVKLKITEKLQNLEIPSYVEDKYAFALNFYSSKLQPLPTYKFGLAFLPSYSNCLPCWSLLASDNALKKYCHKVVSTKYHMDNYRGQLYVDIKHVQVL